MVNGCMETTQKSLWQHVLQRAKAKKNDEFYTSYETVEDAFSRFDFRGRWVYCPCDDWQKSNIVKWFKNNFSRLGLRHLTATCFVPNGNGVRFDFDGISEKVSTLSGDGDFRSKECSDIRDAAGCVATNPPFSLVARFFHSWVRNVDYVYFAHATVLGCSAPFADFRAKQMRLTRAFHPLYVSPSGEKLNVPSVLVFTLSDSRPFVFVPFKEYNPDIHPKYDNFDAINIDRLEDFPKDFYGVVGVPSSCCYKLDRDEFDIVGESRKLRVNGKVKFHRVLLQKVSRKKLENGK